MADVLGKLIAYSVPNVKQTGPQERGPWNGGLKFKLIEKISM
jgi:hypothetical protein